VWSDALPDAKRGNHSTIGFHHFFIYKPSAKGHQQAHKHVFTKPHTKKPMPEKEGNPIKMTTRKQKKTIVRVAFKLQNNSDCYCLYFTHKAVS